MKKILYIVIAIIAVIFISMTALRMYTKTHSPFESISFKNQIQVDYCKPYKKDRVIFGDLVPYDIPWRTGANEATVFTTKIPILFGKKNLDPGTYSLWTIPGKDSWQVILNSEIGQWGVNSSGKANRKPDLDVLSVEVPVINSSKEFDQFTIFFEEVKSDAEMVLVWDKTMISVSIVTK